MTLSGQGCAAFPRPNTLDYRHHSTTLLGCQMLTHERLKTILHYDLVTGIFTWLKMASNPYNSHAGQRAGRKAHRDYRTITIENKRYLEHRLAWFYMTGAWPQDEIDHKNGIRSDNRWDNLRDATRAINMQNRRGPDKDSLTGILGVTQVGQRWRAQIVINGKTKNLGSFDTPEEASNAYIKAKRKSHPGGLL